MALPLVLGNIPVPQDDDDDDDYPFKLVLRGVTPCETT